MAKTRPVRDAGFTGWAWGVYEKRALHISDRKLDTSLTQRPGSLVTRARTTYLENLDPAKSSKTTPADKQVAFVQLKRFMSTFTSLLPANENTGDNDIQAMGLPSREHHYHGPLPAPTDAPELQAITGLHHDITVYVSIPQLGEPSEFLKRKGYHGFLLQYRLAGEVEWHEIYSTRLHQTVVLNDEDEAKYLEVRAAWINLRLQKGPWSDVTRVLIN